MAAAQRRMGVVTMYDTDKGLDGGLWMFQARVQADNSLLKMFPNDDDRRKLKDMVTAELIKKGFQIFDPMNPLMVSAPPGMGTPDNIATFNLKNVPRMNAEGTQQLPPVNVTVNVNPVVSSRPAGTARAAGAGAEPPRGARESVPIPRDPCDDILDKAGIKDKSSFRLWALANHPDKGGEQAKFQEVSDCYDKKLKPKFGGRRKSHRKHRTMKKRPSKRHFSRRR